MSLAAIAADVASGRRSAVSVVRTAIEAIRAAEPDLAAVTRLLDDTALEDAARIDARVAAGEVVGPLAGVPFGVKDLFDVAGLVTTAGSALRRGDPPAAADAEAVRRLRAAGAIPLATLNMDEFAYGFATINAHHGTTRNPHDPTRIAGGSSGGSAAAVAAGLLPLTLGSDTNGSIRVPASLCGVWGLKPTHGGLPMAGVAPFVDSFDDIGPFTASLEDLRLACEVLGDAPIADAPATRIARLGGWFARNLAPDVKQAMAAFDLPEVELPHAEAARSAAFLMTAHEGGALHLPDLRTRALEYDPAVRDRLLAGALLSEKPVADAHRFRAWFRAQALALFERFDVLIAPATPAVAPTIADPMIDFESARVPARSHLGILTQPLSFIGLPVIAAPLARPGRLPLDVQLIAAPGNEAALFACARALAEQGLLAASIARQEIAA